MSDDRLRFVDTSFASAARADGPTLHAQRDAFLSDPVAVALLDAMPGPSMVLNANRQIVAVNGVLRSTFGVADPEALLGLRPGEALQCVHGDERPNGCGTTRACAKCGAVGAVLECLTTGKRVTRETRVRTRGDRDGGALDLRVHASQVKVSGTTFVVVGIEDIGGEKRREVLERTFFRDLLGTCWGLHDLAERLDVTGGATGREAEERRELHLLSDLALEQIEWQRALFAAERGQLEAIPCAVDFGALLEEIVERYRRHPLGAGRTIRLETARHCVLRTDPGLLSRSVGDLLKNALEATSAGGTVSVSCECDRTSATLSIHNEGVIPEDVQMQIFQRSFTTRQGEGRGVGTYGVKLLVERFLNGSVQFVSDERVGTLFVIVVPPMPEARKAA